MSIFETRREAAQRNLMASSLLVHHEKTDEFGYVYALMQSRFMLSPLGNGADSTRTWQVQRSPTEQKAY